MNALFVHSETRSGNRGLGWLRRIDVDTGLLNIDAGLRDADRWFFDPNLWRLGLVNLCLLYTSDAADE